MPNFKLGDHYKATVRQGVVQIVENYVRGFQNGFPLTHDEVQQCTVDRDILFQFEALWTAGARTIRRSTNMTCFLGRDVTQDLKRHCMLTLSTTREDGFFTAKDATPYCPEPFGRDRSKLIALDVCSLPDERVQATVEWCHALIRATRLRQMVNVTVDRVLNVCPSTAHLMANWPALASFAKADPTLRKRLAAAPAKLDRYIVLEHFLPPKKQRDAANVVLTMGAMALEASKNTDEAEVKGSVLQFESKPEDPKF